MSTNITTPERRETQRYSLREFMHAIFKRRFFFFGFPVLIIIVIVLLSILIPPVYEASTQVKIEDTDYEQLGLSAEGIHRSDVFLSKDEQINSEADIARSDIVMEGVVRKLELWRKWTPTSMGEEDRVNRAVRRLSSGINVEPLRDSWTIRISYRSTDPKLAADAVNAVAEEYISRHISLNKLAEASEFYEEKLEKERKELDDLKSQLRGMKLNNRVVAYDSEIEQMLENQSVFESQLTEVKKEIISRRSKIGKVREFLSENQDVLVPNKEIAEMDIISDLDYRLVQKIMELQLMELKYTDKTDRMKNLKAQISSLKEQLKIEVLKILAQEQTELRSLEAERDALVVAIREQENELLNKQGIEGPYKTLERKIETKEEIVANLTKKYADSLYAGETDTRIGGAKQISPASAPTSPVFPTLWLNLLIGIPVAIIIALAVVMLMDYFDRTLPTPEKAERLIEVPILATINWTDFRKDPLFR